MFAVKFVIIQNILSLAVQYITFDDTDTLESRVGKSPRIRPNHMILMHQIQRTVSSLVERDGQRQTGCSIINTVCPQKTVCKRERDEQEGKDE